MEGVQQSLNWSSLPRGLAGCLCLKFRAPAKATQQRCWSDPSAPTSLLPGLCHPPFLAACLGSLANPSLARSDQPAGAVSALPGLIAHRVRCASEMRPGSLTPARRWRGAAAQLSARKGGASPTPATRTLQRGGSLRRAGARGAAGTLVGGLIFERVTLGTAQMATSGATHACQRFVIQALLTCGHTVRPPRACGGAAGSLTRFASAGRFLDERSLLRSLGVCHSPHAAWEVRF